jgi:hypothetical protein
MIVTARDHRRDSMDRRLILREGWAGSASAVGDKVKPDLTEMLSG